MSPIYLVYILTLIHLCYAPPVKEGTKEHDNDNDNENRYNPEDLEYHRYLSEVVQALESDPDFKSKIEKAPEDDIRSGKIANELEFVSHHVRTKLDEIKRVELERLKTLIEKKRALQENIDNEDPTHKHLDHSNPHTFEIEDLKKLIAKTHEDLNEADKKRREEFKQYELQKEFEKQAKLNSTTGEERAKLEKQFKEEEEKHKKHEKLHEPGHKAQLEEVWQEQDQMQQEFDPKTFFLLHDMDSNGVWDQTEVKALFLKELDKMYQSGAPEDDIRERIEEMERMRETVFKEVDTNYDGVIDFQEFLAQTKRQDFKEDNGWNGLDEQKPYSDDELQEYISRHQAAQFQQHPPPLQHGGPVPPGMHPNMPPQAQFHPGQMPHLPPQQVPGHLPAINTNEVYPQHPNVPQNTVNQGYQQMPNQVYQHNQPNQVYQQNQPNQQMQYQNQQYQQQNQGNVQSPQNTYQQQQQYNNLQQNQGNVPQQQQQQPIHQGSYQNPNQVNAQANIQGNQIPQQTNNIQPQQPVVKQV